MAKNPVGAGVDSDFFWLAPLLGGVVLKDKCTHALLLRFLRPVPVGHAAIASLPPLAGEASIAQNLMYARFFA
jgi:hypothetical protein